VNAEDTVMREPATTFWEYLEEPLRGRSRVLLALLVLPLLATFLFPLWRISMEAAQYPKGLSMDIWSYKLVGGHDGKDIAEINTLNHYIGMRTITREELRDLDWLPFAFAAIALLALRTALLGKVRTLVDLSTITGFVLFAAFGRFAWMLWEFGHDLDPKAPFDVEPFMPVLIGSKKVANFTTHSMPQLGTVLMTVFAFGVWGMTLLYLWRGRRQASAALTLAA
jgi:copper chaperone NosL